MSSWFGWSGIFIFPALAAALYGANCAQVVTTPLSNQKVYYKLNLTLQGTVVGTPGIAAANQNISVCVANPSLYGDAPDNNSPLELCQSAETDGNGLLQLQILDSDVHDLADYLNKGIVLIVDDADCSYGAACGFATQHLSFDQMMSQADCTDDEQNGTCIFNIASTLTLDPGNTTCSGISPKGTNVYNFGYFGPSGQNTTIFPLNSDAAQAQSDLNSILPSGPAFGCFTGVPIQLDASTTRLYLHSLSLL